MSTEPDIKTEAAPRTGSQPVVAAKTLSRRSSQLPTTFVARLPSRKAYSVRTRRDSQAGAVTPGLNRANRVEAGSEQQVFDNACRTCHTIKEGDNRLGPNLHKIIGRKAGSLPDYNFSSAMKSAGFIWDEEKLDHFIANPDEVVPGNNMKPYG